MTASRRAFIAGALVVPFGLPAASAPAATFALVDPDPWVRLATERRMLIQMVNDCAFDGNGNVPDDVASYAWGRSAEIDAEIARSLPRGPAGLRAALEQYGREVRDGYGLDEAVTLALFGASIAMAEGRAA